MKRKTLLPLIAMGSYALLSASQIVAQESGNAEAGKYEFATCSGCHAIPGYTNSYPTYHVPRLGGQHAEYIVNALTAYKAGERSHDTMHANAANLTDESMANIAAFLAGFELEDDVGPDSGGDAAAGETKAAACNACHGAENAPPPQPPRLAGQFQDYLMKALKDYQSGARNNAIMAGMAAPLTDEDIADITAYYSQQSPGLAVIHYSGKE